ncbi:S-methyl-5-thioribose kinase [Morganella psychrotolerans]|uniref:S-methyl-5-thioribose kinase n=1 Tax=Morganella psychrotolerans TaxID=368603 RepID=A0A5M9RCZ6_9GAMM|nr:S-methyl-5-thioribose kinase [Morganella psychrotolerans]KAA8717956.1 S-methyl-5-thioribose kinase [Morganella psychrotolerans]OBU07002.1 S-methyl-5-thioribose kinase [Morganella psychrotolerans]
MTRATPAGYTPQTSKTLPAYLAAHLPPHLQLDGSPDDWRVEEVGDGNLNLVFIVRGRENTLVVKQSLPYVRAAGESWPLSLQRNYFEYHALSQEKRFAPDYVPDVYFYDETMALFAMEYLDDHIILRKTLIAGKFVPGLAEKTGLFMAQTLFHTSDLGMNAQDKKALTAQFSANHELCKITEDLIFTEPYYPAPRNQHTSPQLDKDANAVMLDREMVQVAMRYKYKFMTQTQALLHGDLHSGSIMTGENSVQVIDPEFSFMGPMAFDTGNYIGNLYMAWFSQPAHRKNENETVQYQQWLLSQISQTWSVFETEFRRLWTEKQQGDAWPRVLYQEGLFDDKFLRTAQDSFFAELFQDTLVNAGLEINCRLLGFAGVADFKSIKDADLRATLERKALKLARELIVNARHYRSFDDITPFLSYC